MVMDFFFLILCSSSWNINLVRRIYGDYFNDWSRIYSIGSSLGKVSKDSSSNNLFSSLRWKIFYNLVFLSDAAHIYEIKFQ